MMEVRSMMIAKTVEYATLPPQDGDSRAPLLIALHGWGQTCAGFMTEMAPLASAGIGVAAPQAPHPFYVKTEERRVGFSWLTRHRRDESVAELVAYLDALRVRLESELPHDPARVYVLGFSQGASIAYRYATLTERPVAGVVSCGSDLPQDVAARLGTAAPAQVLLVHGEGDRIVPIHTLEPVRVALEAAGVPVAVHTFRGGHRIAAGAVTAIGDWILGKDQAGRGQV